MTASAATGRLVTAYRARAAALHDAHSVAALQAATWRAVDAALRDVIGPLGATALLARSLVLAQRQHAGLSAALPAAQQPDNSADLIDMLQATLKQLPLADAQAAGQTLVQLHNTLLSNLIGTALADRLLQPVWPHTPGNAPSENNTP